MSNVDILYFGKPFLFLEWLTFSGIVCLGIPLKNQAPDLFHSLIIIKSISCDIGDTIILDNIIQLLFKYMNINKYNNKLFERLK